MVLGNRIFQVFIASFLLAGFPLSHSAESKNSKDPETSESQDRWHFFPCAMGDEQAFIFVNTGIEKKINVAPSSLAKLELTYKSPRDDGLPTREEYEPVRAIEDRIEQFSKEENDWYVGRITVGGNRIFYIYTSRSEASWELFLQHLMEESGYTMRLIYREDPNQTGYREDLYPTDDDWQVIKDLQVIENLETHGDDGTEIRRVDHWVYFESELAAADFLVWAESDRFTTEPKYSHKTDEGDYCLRLFHYGSLKIGDISSHTITLRRMAEKYGGRYDGWEAPIITPEE